MNQQQFGRVGVRVGLCANAWKRGDNKYSCAYSQHAQSYAHTHTHTNAQTHATPSQNPHVHVHSLAHVRDTATRLVERLRHDGVPQQRWRSEWKPPLCVLLDRIKALHIAPIILEKVDPRLGKKLSIKPLVPEATWHRALAAVRSGARVHACMQNSECVDVGVNNVCAQQRDSSSKRAGASVVNANTNERKVCKT
jgi:hypothetical protein